MPLVRNGRNASKTQLDSYTQTSISCDRAPRLWASLLDLLQVDKRTNVLEVGCGASPFTEVLLSRNGCVTSVDE